MKAQPRSITATQAKNRLGDYLAIVTSGKEPVVIERHGRPIAVLLDYGEWVQEHPLQGKKKLSWSEELEQLAQKIAAEHPDPEPRSAVDLLNQIREEDFSR